jgi:hypothetical protein
MTESVRLRRFLSEGAVIVLSILIAFWIDAWWGERQETIQELALLDALAAEVESNRVAMDDFVERTETGLARIDGFFRADPESLRSLPADSTGPWIRAVFAPWTFDPDITAAEVLLSRPFPSSRRASEVRPVVAEWVRLLEDSEEEKKAMTDRGVAVIGHLAGASTAAYARGRAPLFEMASRLGPTFVADLREDVVFMGLVGEKSHHQQTYLEELGLASVVLDSLVVILGAER